MASLLREENRERFLGSFVGVDLPRGGEPWESALESDDDGEEEGEKRENRGFAWLGKGIASRRSEMACKNGTRVGLRGLVGGG